MKLKLRKSGIANTFLAIIGIALILSLFLTAVGAEPSGPTVSIEGNPTKAAAAGTKVNSSNATSSVVRSPGGMIFTANLQSDQQNTRWKAYVGNVTGTLTLDDASSNTIYQWTLSTVTGEVFSTRASGSINWSGINCTWIADGKINATQGITSSNRTPEHNENIVLSHTSPDDNITATFSLANHSSMTVGSVAIGKNNCFTTQTRQNDNAQVFLDSDNANYTEILLYDGAYNKTSGNLVYATFIYDDLEGYNSQSYDFQMILPESAAVGFTSSTAYYFYVELS